MVKQFSRRFTALNKLNNGNFAILPFEYSRKVLCYGENVVEDKRVSWYKERYRKKVLLSEEIDRSTVIGWDIWCDSTEGVSLEYDPIDTNTGYRLWSRDGGHVLLANFKTDCVLYMEQELYSFNEFPMNDATIGISAYPVSGHPNVYCEFDYGNEDPAGVMSVYIGKFGKFFRVTEKTTCPGRMNKFVVRFRVSGSSGDAIGISGIALLLGDNRPECPYSDNSVYYTIPSGTILLTEGDKCPQGYEELDSGYMFYQTYGDATSLTTYPGKEIELTNYPMQDTIGTDQHNAHYSNNPFITVDSGWLTDEAWRGLRLRGLDLSDRGGETRQPNLIWYLNTFSLGFGGQWGTIIDAAFSGATEIEGQKSILVNEFSKSSRVLQALPATSGTAFDLVSGSDSGKIDEWDQKHMHWVVPEKGETLPPYRPYRSCMKL